MPRKRIEFNTTEGMVEQVAGKTSTQQKPVSATEKKQRINTRRTQGRRGCSMPRINTGYNLDAYNYIRVMARVTGKTMSQFVNDIVNEHRLTHIDTYNKALAFEKELLKNGQSK